MFLKLIFDKSVAKQLNFPSSTACGRTRGRVLVYCDCHCCTLLMAVLMCWPPAGFGARLLDELKQLAPPQVRLSHPLACSPHVQQPFPSQPAEPAY